MRRFRATARQLLFPQGTLLVLAILFAGVQPSFGLTSQMQFGLAFALTLAAGLLAWRFHSLKAFLTLLSISFALPVLYLLSGSDPGLFPGLLTASSVLVAANIGFLTLVDDGFFDWQAVQWWGALLTVQWTLFSLVAYWQPGFLAHASGWQLPLLSLVIGPMQWAFGLCALAMLVRLLYAPDPVSTGIFSAVIALAFAFGRGPQTLFAFFGLAALLLGVSLVEWSYWIAFHDELTTLPGRRAFKQALAGVAGRYSIAMVDVDHFKSFNDNFGHEIGDQVLRKVAGHLAEAGGGGKAFRFGGEEFAVLFPGMTMEQAQPFAEEIRRAIESHVFVVRGPERSMRKRTERRTHHRGSRSGESVRTHVTVSIGLGHSFANDGSAQEVIEAADAALYVAKGQGRNRVELASSRSASAKGRAGSSTPSGRQKSRLKPRSIPVRTR